MSSRSLWLPSFSKSDLYFSDNLKNSHSLKDFFPNIQMTKNGLDKEFESIEQYLEIEMKHDKNDNNSGIKLLPTINDIVIHKSFLFSVINLDILSETSIPTIFTTVINNTVFNKSNSG